MKNISIVGKLLLANEFRASRDEEEQLSGMFEKLVQLNEAGKKIADSTIVTMLYRLDSKHTPNYFMSVITALVLSYPDLAPDFFRRIETEGRSASVERIRQVVYILLHSLRKYPLGEQVRLLPVVLDTIKGLLSAHPSVEKIDEHNAGYISETINSLPVTCSRYFVSFLRDVKQLSEGGTPKAISFRSAVNSEHYCLNQLVNLFSYFILRRADARHRAIMAIELYHTLHTG